MKDKYRSYFLVPSGANRILGEGGWEFESAKTIPRAVMDSLMLGLMLQKSGGSIGMERFTGKDAEATVFLNDFGDIEHVYLRAYSGREIDSELQALIASYSLDLEIFDPRKEIQKNCSL